MLEGTEEIGGLVKETRDLVEEYVKPVIVAVTDPVSSVSAPAVLGKDGLTEIPASVFSDYLDKPRFRRGTAALTALDSFIHHVNRFKSESSAVFASDDPKTPSLTAVLDYHPAGHDSAPAFGRHRSAFSFPLSDEWKAWHESNGSQMTMIEFAQFLEDRILDVEHPDDIALADDKTNEFVTKLGGKKKIASPTRLLELSTGLSINENSVVKQHAKLQSGEGHMVLQSEHVDDKGTEIDIPSMFVLAIPVFDKGSYYRVLVRLRYRVMGGVTFWYELWRTDRVFDHAFDEACVKVNAETGLDVLYGSPE